MRLIWLALACLAASSALAHEPSRALLTLTVAYDRLDGRLEVSLRDLEDAIGVDANGDLAITWGELERRRPEIVRYALDHLRVGGDGAACALHAGELAVDAHGGATYAALALSAPACAAQARVTIDYALLFEVDPAHRALVSLDGEYAASGILSADQPTLEVLRNESAWASFRRFVAEGVVHIWQGYDHLAFLALLVLPALLGRHGASAARSWRPALVDIGRIVTAFTAAHSLTLGLAVLGVIDVPVRAVEGIIAASVLIAAIMNLLPGSRAARLAARVRLWPRARSRLRERAAGPRYTDRQRARRVGRVQHRRGARSARGRRARAAAAPRAARGAAMRRCRHARELGRVRNARVRVAVGAPLAIE